MFFNSINYFFFLPVVFLAHHFSPARFRWIVLLTGSFAFYAALKAPHLILVLLLVTSVSYITGLWIQKTQQDSTKLWIMWAGICFNVLLLGILKHPSTNKAVIAIGTSYYIFQAIAYIADVYLEKITPERHFGYFTLYMSFFPKLLQGPIERGENLLPQLRQPYIFDYDNVRSGMVMFAWGLTKKIVVADRLAVFTNNVFSNVEVHSGLSLILAVYFYTIQIYCDFSGYTDMARGTAKMFNIDLARNFNKPYLAESIQDFWSRWHISLSSWLQDYIFKPLQLNTRDFGKLGTIVSILVTFLICGIWHGTTYCFLVWGMLHGIYLSISFLLKPYTFAINKKLSQSHVHIYKASRVILTFHLIALTWIPFRADSLNDAYYVITHLHMYLYDQLTSLVDQGIINRNLKIGGVVGWNLSSIIVALAVTAVGSLLYNNYLTKHSTQTLTGRWVFYCYILESLIMLGTTNGNNFIYLNF